MLETGGVKIIGIEIKMFFLLLIHIDMFSFFCSFSEKRIHVQQINTFLAF